MPPPPWGIVYILRRFCFDTTRVGLPMLTFNATKLYCSCSDIFKLSVSLPCDAVRKLGLCCGPVSVCLSVTLVYCIQTAEDIVKLFVGPVATSF